MTGGEHAIGLLHGPRVLDDSEAKADVSAKSTKYVQRFAQDDGSARCRELIDLDISSPDAPQAYREGNLGDRCTKIVRESVRTLLTFVDEWYEVRD